MRGSNSMLNLSSRYRRSSTQNLRVRVRADVRRQERIRYLGVLVVILALAACGVAGWFSCRLLGKVLFSGNDTYTLKTLDIRGGGSIVRDFIRGKHNLTEGINLFSFNIEELSRDFLAGAPSFKSIQIRRILPDTLTIEVVERSPLASIGRSGILVVDREGVVFGMRSRFEHLPVITGTTGAVLKPGDRVTGVLRDAVTLLDVCDQTLLGSDLSIVQVDVRGGFGGREDALNLELRDGVRVALWWPRGVVEETASLQDLKDRLRVLSGVIRRSKADGRLLQTVNLTLDSYRQNCPITLRTP